MRQLELTERILRIRGVPTLRTLPATEIAQLARSMRSVTFKKGDVMLREDEPPRCFYLLMTGTATLARKMVEERLPAGQVLWREGDRSDFSYFVVKGMMSLRWGGGKYHQQIGPGYVVGGAESLVGIPRWNELTTDEPVIVLRGTR